MDKQAPTNWDYVKDALEQFVFYSEKGYVQDEVRYLTDSYIGFIEGNGFHKPPKEK